MHLPSSQQTMHLGDQRGFLIPILNWRPLTLERRPSTTGMIRRDTNGLVAWLSLLTIVPVVATRWSSKRMDSMRPDFCLMEYIRDRFGGTPHGRPRDRRLAQ